MNKKTETPTVKKIEAPVSKPDAIRQSIRDHVTALKSELVRLQSEQEKCINERAHELQFYKGRAHEVEKEIEYLDVLLIDS